MDRDVRRGSGSGPISVATWRSVIRDSSTLPAETQFGGAEPPMRAPTRTTWSLSTASTISVRVPCKTIRCTVSSNSSDSASSSAWATSRTARSLSAASPMTSKARPAT